MNIFFLPGNAGSDKKVFAIFAPFASLREIVIH